MYEFTVNGTVVRTEKEMKLLPFLREELGLTSVKNGCSQGACGTCTVIVDGKAVKSCVLSTSKAAGKHILTCEGLSKAERDVWAYAFSKCGAVQCGFCTPGMVMACKALVDMTPDPSRDDVVKAIRGNLCRCTGYKKVVDGALLAAKMLREGLSVPPEETDGSVGERMMRVDAPAKAVGEAKYADDLVFPDMLHGTALRSAYPRARIVSIDTSAAEALPGVACVLTASDIPGKIKIGHLKKDYDVMIPVGEVTHFLGDAVALVAADTLETANAAKALIRVEYEPLEPVLTLEAATSDTIVVHAEMGETTNLYAQTHVRRGDPDAVIASSKYVVTTHYFTPETEHAFLEPETAVARPEKGGVVVYSGDQGIYQTRGEVSEMLGLPPEKVRVVAAMVGGGFGGKEDMSVQHHAALLAYLTKKPVKVSLTRDESILIHPKRHPMEMDFTTACDENGHLTAMKAVLLTDSGAYASLGGPVLQRACTHAAGPYNYQHVDILGHAYYSNNPPCGAFRGFGVTQSCFATEMNLDLLAKKVGISPWEIRWRNAIRPGQTLPNGQIAGPDTALAECLQAVKPYFDAHPDAGIACAMKNSGLGVGIPDAGRVRLAVKNGVCEIHSSAACIGQGMGTVLTQIAHEVSGLPLSQIRYCTPDTADSPNSGNTTASRQTLFTGEATRRAALELKSALAGRELCALEDREFLGEYLGVTDPLGSDKPNPVSHIAYTYAANVVILGDDDRVKTVVAAYDVGHAVNPTALEGQIEGGAVMALGWALTEHYTLENGRPKEKFGTLGLLRADQVPEVIPIIVEKSDCELACGAKGIGEIAAIPAAPAAALAYWNRDGRFRGRLPLEDTPYSRK
jgi:aldehyde oxidoreductase